jgi:hypothetical protein
VDFCQLAAGSGYAAVDRLADPAGFAAWLDRRFDGPAFLHAPMLTGTAADLPRPHDPPDVVARRFAGGLGVGL